MSRILHGKLSEEAILINKATNFPRFKGHSFRYRNFKIEVSDFLSVAWQIKEFFGDERMAFYSEESDPVIIDCGSNVGISALYFKSIFPQARITCFEADPAIAEILKRNLKSNGAADVVVHQKAVWTHSKGVSFGSEGADGGSVQDGGNTVFVPSVRFKEILQQFDRVDLLKIDIEGAEVEVLGDCSEELYRVKYLYVEYHSLSDRPQELDKLLLVLKNNGFRYYINRIGAFHAKPFINVQDAAMDIQLDIHAIR